MAIIRDTVKTSSAIGGAIQRAAISVNSSGDNVVVSGVAGKFILVMSYQLSAASNVTVRWESEDGTVISGAMPILASTPVAAEWNPEGHFKTALAGDDLILNLSGAIAVGGHMSYIFIPAS